MIIPINENMYDILVSVGIGLLGRISLLILGFIISRIHRGYLSVCALRVSANFRSNLIDDGEQ